MPPRFSKGLIYIIPKSDGVSDDVRRWRLITIFNTSYKIMAEAISFLLDLLIHVSQIGF
jgi:hypothetical protein